MPTTGLYKAPVFVKSETDAAHFRELRKLVSAEVERLPRSRRQIARLKAFVFPALYIGVYAVSLTLTNYLLFCLAYAFLGLIMVIMFLNLIHEACHGNLFKSKELNRNYMLLMDLIGGNSYMWRKRHIHLHHNYINVENWDSDIEKSQFLKVHPQAKTKLLNRYQHLLVLLYPMFVTNWFLIRDFKDFFSSKMIVRKLGKIPRLEYFKLFLFKLLFIMYLVVLPVFVTAFSWIQIAGAFFMMLISAGFFALFVLLPPHVNTSNQFPVADDQMNLPYSWLLHQLNTTNDVDNSNWFTRHMMANFNFHIAHHLFPNISYVYAKEVTQVIKDYARKNGLPYKSYPIMTTFKNHYQLIKNNQLVPDLLEEDM